MDEDAVFSWSVDYDKNTDSVFLRIGGEDGALSFRFASAVAMRVAKHLATAAVKALPDADD